MFFCILLLYNVGVSNGLPSALLSGEAGPGLIGWCTYAASSGLLVSAAVFLVRAEGLLGLGCGYGWPAPPYQALAGISDVGCLI